MEGITTIQRKGKVGLRQGDNNVDGEKLASSEYILKVNQPSLFAEVWGVREEKKSRMTPF